MNYRLKPFVNTCYIECYICNCTASRN